jgi:hypothetical protein
MTPEDTELRWIIIPPSHVATFTSISLKLGMDLEQEDILLSEELLTTAIKEGIVIYECFLRLGEIMYIPAGSLYQVLLTSHA